jgi:hypothetical protein
MKVKNKNIDYHTTGIIGNSKVDIYVEKLKTDTNNLEKYEFLFEIDNSTSNNNKLVLIKELYQLFLMVQDSLFKYIEENIIDKLDGDKIIQLLIEPEGKDDKEVKLKDNLYHYHLKRLAKQYNDIIDDVVCTYIKQNNTHILNFSKT